MVSEVLQVSVNAEEYCFLAVNWWVTCLTKSEWASWAQAAGVSLTLYLMLKSFFNEQAIRKNNERLENKREIRFLRLHLRKNKCLFNSFSELFIWLDTCLEDFPGKGPDPRMVTVRAINTFAASVDQFQALRKEVASLGIDENEALYMSKYGYLIENIKNSVDMMAVAYKGYEEKTHHYKYTYRRIFPDSTGVFIADNIELDAERDAALSELHRSQAIHQRLLKSMMPHYDSLKSNHGELERLLKTDN